MRSTLVIISFLFLYAGSVFAAPRNIIISVTSHAPYGAKDFKVAIVSDVPSEHRADLSIDEAAHILKSARGFNSGIFVYMRSDCFSTFQLKPLFDAIFSNLELHLTYFRTGLALPDAERVFQRP